MCMKELNIAYQIYNVKHSFAANKGQWYSRKTKYKKYFFYTTSLNK